jgi:hypothetical protein
MDLTINKIAAGVVGFAMVAGLALAFTATKAHAVTLTELVELFIALEVIPADKAEEARSVLAGQETTTPSLATAMSCSFTRNLKTGDTGQDVMDLQKLLNAKGYTVSVAGAGSPGQETQYYGPATAAAVSKMQVAFASEILTPLGLTNGTGFFGASTRAKANALCAAETPAVPGDEDEDEDGDEDEDTDLSGEASLKTHEMDSADDDEINEGEEEAEIGEFTVEFSDGDAMITRLDLALVGTSDEESDPWDVFDTMYLMVDGDIVAEKDIDSKSDYLDDDDGTIRFSGLDIVAMEDEELVITIAVDVAGSVDGAGVDQDWTVSAEGMRFVDGTDVTSTETFTETATFSIDEQGGGDELLVKTSSSDLDSSIIKVEDDSKSDWVTVFVFDLDTDDSENDITINSIPVQVVGGVAYATLIDDARLVIDGTTVDSTFSDVTLTTTAVADDTGTIDFDVDGDVVIDAGDRVKAELQLRFKSLDPANEGETIVASMTDGDLIDAEGADDLGTSQLGGSATGEIHKLMTTGIFAEVVSVDTDDAGTDGDIGVFTIKFDVTAFEGDYYIHANADDAADTGALYSFNGVAVATDSGTLSSTADEVVADVFEIKDGETETFTLKINATVGAAGDVRAQLDKLFYAGDSADANDPLVVEEHIASPVEDFRTDYQLINL